MGHIYAATPGQNPGVARIFIYNIFFSTEIFTPIHRNFCMWTLLHTKFFNTGAFLHKRFCTEITLHTNEYIQKLAPIIIFTRNFLLNKNYLFSNIFTDIQFFFPKHVIRFKMCFFHIYKFFYITFNLHAEVYTDKSFCTTVISNKN